MKLGELLVNAGLLTVEQLHEALAEQKRWNGRLGEILIQKGYCTEDVITRALAKQLGLERAVFEPLPELPPMALGRLPYALARELNVVPYRLHERERTLVVAMADPRDRAALEKLREHTGLRVVPAVAGGKALVKARAKLYRVKDELALETAEEAKFTDGKGHTLVRALDELQREHEARKAARAARAPAPPPPVAAPAEDDDQEIEGFTDKRGNTLIRSIEDILREARSREEKEKGARRSEADQPSRAELLATIEALQNEVKALKAVAVVLFKKGLLTHEEYQEQLQKSSR